MFDFKKLETWHEVIAFAESLPAKAHTSRKSNNHGLERNQNLCITGRGSTAFSLPNTG
jgi:hypothetical protein